jgi:hypothetical protein
MQNWLKLQNYFNASLTCKQPNLNQQAAFFVALYKLA